MAKDALAALVGEGAPASEGLLPGRINLGGLPLAGPIRWQQLDSRRWTRPGPCLLGP